MTVSRIRMRVPDLRAQVDATQIKEVLIGAPGINRIVADYEAGILEITTTAQDGGAYAIDLLSNAGYPPSETERLDDDERSASGS